MAIYFLELVAYLLIIRVFDEKTVKKSEDVNFIVISHVFLD